MESIAKLKRPSFLSGSIIINEKPQVKALKETIFRRFQNRDLVRPSFKQTAPRGRHGISVDRLRMIDISEHGSKVQLSDKALKKLSVMVKDETDKAWLKEEKRRLDLGETIADLLNKPPLGRSQRTKEIRVDLGDERLPLAENLLLIESAIKNQDYKDNPEDLLKVVYKVIDDEFKNKKQIKRVNYNRIKNIIKDLKVKIQLYDNIVDLQTFDNSPAKVIMYILSNPNIHVENVLSDEYDNSPVSLIRLHSLLKQGRVIDLENQTLLSSRGETKMESATTQETKPSLMRQKTTETQKTPLKSAEETITF